MAQNQLRSSATPMLAFFMLIGVLFSTTLGFAQSFGVDLTAEEQAWIREGTVNL